MNMRQQEARIELFNVSFAGANASSEPLKLALGFNFHRSVEVDFLK